MKTESVMITGANRGIGLEFVRQLCQLQEPPRYIFATYRSSETLQDLKSLQDFSVKSRVVLIKMDVTEPEEVEVAKQIVEETVGDRGLTLLINNAGIAKPLPFPLITPENMELHFKVNTVGPVMVLQAMLPLLEKAATFNTGGMSVRRAAVLNLTSMVGSIYNTGKKMTIDLIAPSYKISKAALNMAMRAVATNVKDKGILVVAMCPGWVKTDMGGKEHGEIEPEESVANIIQTLASLNETHHGSYMDRLGNEYPF